MATVDVNVVRVRNGQRVEAQDRAVAEEPLEIRLHKRPFATIMRTPGADRELAAGFLLAERVLQSSDDLGGIELCRDVENVVDVMLIGPSAEGLDRLIADRRNVAASAACGVCGRLSIDTLAADLPRVQGALTIGASTLAGLPERLRAGQPLFAATGGLHAAALFQSDGTLRTSAEDVGRHNAVDKIVGRMVMQDALPLSDVVLLVSGRTSFEIIQKAWCAGIPVVAAVSAPSSLAIALARDAGITLVGFVRDGNFNIYTHPERIV